jgi:hypothetical protein
MDQDRTASLRARAVALYQQTRTRAMRLPITVWLILGLFLFAAALMAIHATLGARDASLHLKVQHGLRSAQLSAWVDGDLVYSGKLVGTMKRKFGIIPDLQGSLSETLPVPSGTHEVRIRVASDDGSVQESTITGEFARNSQRTLAVNARRTDVLLSWQGANASLTDSSVSATGWFSRYTGSLMMTVAGSIVSALAGYIIRELPKQIASRRGEARGLEDNLHP